MKWFIVGGWIIIMGTTVISVRSIKFVFLDLNNNGYNNNNITIFIERNTQLSP